MSKIDFGSNESFIENYKKLKSSRKMGILYGCDKGTITKHAKDIGYNYNENKTVKISNIPIEEVIANYEQLQSCSKVGKLYNCSSTAVRNYLIKNNYQLTKFQSIFRNTKPEDFINKYKELKNIEKMAQYYNCSTTSIRNYANKIGFDINTIKNYKLSKEDKEFIINAYSFMSSNELAEKFQVSRGMITKLWYDSNLTGKTIKNTKTTEKNMIGKKFGYWKVIDKSNKRNSSGCIYYNCLCEYNNCGIVKEVLGTSLRQGLTLSCGAHNNISKGNEKIKDILQKANINFEIEKKFETCKDKSYLPFDFYVDNKYLIEYDGIQHFEEGIFDYEYTHFHDLIKNQWCKDNNIPLIRIPYTHFKDLQLKDLKIETTEFLI